MFLEQGYESVSLDELINRVGGSRRNIYAHFGGKQGLFIEVVRKLCAELSEPIEQLNLSGGDMFAALQLFGHRTLQIVLEPRALALHRLMIAEGHRFPELSQVIWSAGHDKAIQILAASMERRRDELRPDIEPLVLAATFVEGLVTGLQLQALIGGRRQPSAEAEIDRQVTSTVATFLTGALRESQPYA
ncbi:TetR/AcrR family transcriptional regulator [Dyella sp. LX-66]|nr:TetR/AcrR family transcriptional regulator [Dyella sp. LX-1]MBT2140074.1 TetR/AcrR family transcriptional regulator [Dyella sp. LX-66]